MQIWIVFRSIISKICYGRKTWRARKHAQEMWKRLRVGEGEGAVCVISGGWTPTQKVAGRKRMNKHLYLPGLPKRRICVGAQGCGLRGIGERVGPWGIITATTIIIIITRPKPAYGRQGLVGSWGQDTDEVSTFLVFLTSHFAPAALSSDLTNLGP